MLIKLNLKERKPVAITCADCGPSIQATHLAASRGDSRSRSHCLPKALVLSGLWGRLFLRLLRRSFVFSFADICGNKKPLKEALNGSREDSGEQALAFNHPRLMLRIHGGKEEIILCLPYVACLHTCMPTHKCHKIKSTKNLKGVRSI